MMRCSRRAALILSNSYWVLTDSEWTMVLNEAGLSAHSIACYDLEQTLNRAFDRIVATHLDLKKAEADFEAETCAEVQRVMPPER
jgi:hypothetical protein